MAKTAPKPETSAPVAAPVNHWPRTPALGSLVSVQVATGVKLVNNETGQFFADDTPTPQTVTITTLRRLNDGELSLV